MNKLAVALLLLASPAFAGEAWVPLTKSKTDFWAVDMGSVVQAQSTATIRIRLSLYEDTSINSVVYTEQFDCRQNVSKTLSIRFTLNGKDTVMERFDTEFGYFVLEVWRKARDLACKPALSV